MYRRVLNVFSLVLLEMFGVYERSCSTRVVRVHVLHGSDDVWMWSDAPMNPHENITECDVCHAWLPDTRVCALLLLSEYH